MAAVFRVRVRIGLSTAFHLFEERDAGKGSKFAKVAFCTITARARNICKREKIRNKNNIIVNVVYSEIG